MISGWEMLVNFNDNCTYVGGKSLLVLAYEYLYNSLQRGHQDYPHSSHMPPIVDHQTPEQWICSGL